MKKTMHPVLMVLLLVGAFLAGSWYDRPQVVTPSTSGARRILYYVDPMNPAHTSDQPGHAPCGMPMEPVYADDDADGEGSLRTALALSPGNVKISAEKQQLIGVRVSRVEMSAGTHALRILGRVAPDEKRLYRLKAAVDGWVQEVSPVTTGGQVEKDQLLATFSTSELFTSAQSYLFAVHSLDHLAKLGMESPAEINPTNANFQQRVERLLSLGMSAVQVEEIKRTREVPQSIKVFAPAAGFVLARNVSPGEKFEKSAEWYRIADLSRVWILADVFEHEADYIKPGVKAQITLPHRNKSLHATVSDILPQFDPATRTHKVRLEVDNPGFVLRPDMFVDVEFQVELPPAITVPVDAVLDSGRRKTVFVDIGNGFFEPREVETGWRLGEKAEIVTGLMPGEQIVVSGNFLIDSESRMKLAAAGMRGTREKDPVCHMEVYPSSARKAGLTIDLNGMNHYFCSPECKTQFEKEHNLQVDKP